VTKVEEDYCYLLLVLLLRTVAALVSALDAAGLNRGVAAAWSAGAVKGFS
jgi:hypothetical protein